MLQPRARRRLEPGPRPPARRRQARARALAALAAALGLGAPDALGLLPSATAQVAAPGPESFAKEPTTPIEFWEAADYLVRAGQPEQAVPYLQAFLKSTPSDDVLVQIADQFGIGSALRLDRDPATKPFAQPTADLIGAATRRQSRRADRLARAVGGLSRTRAEQDFALDRLREAGPYAVGPILDALRASAQTPEERALISGNLGRLETTAVPALLAALDAPDNVAADVAAALGRIGDRRALPALTYYAAKPDSPDALRRAARDAVARLTGQPYDRAPTSPTRVLADEARKYVAHAVAFPGPSVELWSYDARSGQPVAREVPVAEAEAELGIQAASRALTLDPTDAEAQAALVALALRRGVERAGGLARFPASDPAGAFPRALAAGPDVLARVLRRALDDGQSELAAAAATALGRVIDRNAISAGRPPSPLVMALTWPDRRVQFAAARALIDLEPRRGFPGSSRVVPVLARFIADPSAPAAVVIDGNVDRGNRLAAQLRELGLDPRVAVSGDDGFRIAAETADVEAVFIDPTALQGAWRTVDTLTNLRADARTAGLPVFLIEPDLEVLDPSRLDPALGTQAEREPNNDIAQARTLNFPADRPAVRIAGTLTDGDRAGDFYRLGPIEPGRALTVSLVLPSTSTLRHDELVLTLEREVRTTGRVDRRSFVVATADRDRIRYTVPATPEAEPKPEPPKDEPDPRLNPTPRVEQPVDESGNPLPKTYGGYYLHIRGKNELRDRGAFPEYILHASLIRPTPTPGRAVAALRLQALASGLPRVAVITPTLRSADLKRQLDPILARLGYSPLSDAERSAFADEAAGLLARIAARPGSPFGADIPRAGPALATALNSPGAGLAASAALGDVPGPDAQRGLADAALDPSRPIALRRRAAAQLARSVQRFGRLLAADQERRLVDAPGQADDPALRSALAAAVGAMRPRAETVGRQLGTYRLPPANPAPKPDADADAEEEQTP